MKIKRALLSVYDKTGIVPLAKMLKNLGVEIISTGGTAALLKKSGVRVKDISSVTGFPEMLDGRVKTLHPKIHAALLALRDNPSHQRTIRKRGIRPIDLVVVNLYPFARAAQTKTEEREILEMIDIGGPAMLRSAAKNFRSVAVVSDPADYQIVMRQLKKGGVLQEDLLRRLASKVFKLTSSYDQRIAKFFDGGARSPRPGEGTSPLPDNIQLDFEKKQDLRYGENPHQKGALYRERTLKRSGLLAARQLGGKELSFNNILDLDAALEMAEAFEGPACAIVKHTSPCGFALAKTAKSAFLNAYACDSLSAFGGIVGFNAPVDGLAARAILNSGFLECVVARAFSKEALALLRTKKNLRLLAVPGALPRGRLDFKKIQGGLLVQDRDRKDPAVKNLKCVTKKRPAETQIRDLLFAFKLCRYVKSNAIVVAKNGMTVGLGMGQPSRVDSCLVAFKKARARARGAVLASDGFFPKPDSIALAKKHGIKAIIQPGGSIQDEAVIKACDRAGIAMVFTGIRHFKH